MHGVCRSEEPQGTQIATFPRRIEGLARQEDSRRKRQRQSKRTREEEREQQRKEEVKRLKNLKKREVGDACASAAVLHSCHIGEYCYERWYQERDRTRFGCLELLLVLIAFLEFMLA